MSSVEELLASSNATREQGNQAVKAQQWMDAITCYTNALQDARSARPNTDDELAAVQRAILLCHLNRAVAHNKLSNPKLMLDDCNKALAIEPRNTKGILRRASALLQLEQLDEAQKDIAVAEEVCEPGCKEVAMLKRTAAKLVKVRDSQDAVVFKAMMQGLSTPRNKAASPAAAPAPAPAPAVEPAVAEQAAPFIWDSDSDSDDSGDEGLLRLCPLPDVDDVE